jgi:hypothetical protein
MLVLDTDPEKAAEINARLVSAGLRVSELRPVERSRVRSARRFRLQPQGRDVRAVWEARGLPHRSQHVSTAAVRTLRALGPRFQQVSPGLCARES